MHDFECDCGLSAGPLLGRRSPCHPGRRTRRRDSGRQSSRRSAAGCGQSPCECTKNIEFRGDGHAVWGVRGTRSNRDISGGYGLSGEQLRVSAVLAFCFIGTLWFEFVFRRTSTVGCYDCFDAGTGRDHLLPVGSLCHRRRTLTFDVSQVTGCSPGDLPLDEVLFFIVIPCCAILTLGGGPCRSRLAGGRWSALIRQREVPRDLHPTGSAWGSRGGGRGPRGPANPPADLAECSGSPTQSSCFSSW